MILELKIASDVSEMDNLCDKALSQIEEQRYAEPFAKEGYPDIKKYAICFYKKECMVRKA